MNSKKHKILKSITLLYIVIPLLIFLIGWLKTSVAAIAGGLTAIYIFAVAKELVKDILNYWSSRKKSLENESNLNSFAWIIPACVFILVVFCFSGIGGAGYQNSDYLEHNPRLRELIIQDWPISLTIEYKAINYVYYFGYYLPAGLIGKIVQSWLVANVVMFFWSLAGVFLAFAWFVKISRIDLTHQKREKAKRLFSVSLLFILAGGLDLIGAYIVKGMPFDITTHVDFWPEIFQYSSNTTLLYWVPQHTIIAWLLTGVIADTIYHPQNLRFLGMTIAASSMWSPFSVVGIAPFFVLIVIIYSWEPEYRKHLYNLQSFFLNISAILISSIILLYLASNEYQFPIGWIWEFEKERAQLLLSLREFWILEFGFLSILVLLLILLASRIEFQNAAKSIEKSFVSRLHISIGHYFNINPRQLGIFLVAIIILILLPLFKVGLFNDLVMRGSIPALFLVWSFVGKILIDTNPQIKQRLRWLYITILVVTGLGFYSSIAEIARSIDNYHFGPPKLAVMEEYTFEFDPDKVIQRVGVDDSFYYKYLSK